MTMPLVAPDIAEVARTGPILVIEQRKGDLRDTPSHTHAPGQLIGSLAGLLSVTAQDGSWVVPVTHAIWIPPQVPHALRSHGPFEGWSVYVTEDSCVRLPNTPRTLRVSGLLREAVHRAAGWGHTPQTEAEHRLAGVLLDEIVALPIEPLGLPRPSDPRVRRITDAMLGNLGDNRPLRAWADWAGVTPRTLARRFTVETGFGFSEWRQRARALRSIEMLAEGLPVTTIAMDLGYDNVSAFIAMFRRTMGVTPGRYSRSQASG
ncbi:AraC family transcriptional regulator [Sphingomonas endolithica]|uniref:AraC family transcriptional regulator n=1 Tax=Sphingomonas endolithica TaxID=2972485 RepID=UPI0021AF9915|nr:helix-turn-helix transcriptional regulator [Sphingomonas sp. ZFBP2030]